MARKRRWRRRNRGKKEEEEEEEGKDEGERLQLSAKWVRFWAAHSDGMGFQARTILSWLITN